MLNKFSTLEAAIIAQEADYNAMIANYQNNPAYISTTLRWSLIFQIQGLDGYYYYSVCPYSTSTYETIEETPEMKKRIVYPTELSTEFTNSD
jgi:hypothetical protein